MGYWGTSRSGESFAAGVNDDGSEMLWGDAPADALDEGIVRLVTRLRLDLGRFPTVEEVDAVKATAPEMVAAIVEASKAFRRDIERDPSDAEIAAGLAFSDTEISLDSIVRADVVVGDSITWAVMRDNGFYKEIDYIAGGEVTAIVEQEFDGYNGVAYSRPFYEVLHDGVSVLVDCSYANKVLPGDKTVEEINAERDARSNNK